MPPFATVDDLEAGWRPLSEVERGRAEVLLARASALIRATCPDVDERVALGRLDSTIPLMVACAVVQRAMAAPYGYEGVQGTTETAGPYSESLTFANPTGNFWLTKADKKMLGCGGGRAYMVDMAPDLRSPYGDWDTDPVWRPIL